MNGNPFGEYANEIPNYTSNSWIEKELARRYLVGGLLHVNRELRTDGFRKQAIIDATNIYIMRLNQLALVYDSGLGDHKNTEPLDDQKEVDKLLDDALGRPCKLCRREAIPSSAFCEDCDRLAEETERSFPESHNLIDDLLENR